MKKWLSLSMLLPVFCVLYSLSTKFGLTDTKIDPILFTFCILSFSSVIGLIYFFSQGNKLVINWETIIAGIAFGLAACGLNLGIEKSNNPGLAQAAYRFQAVLTTLGGYLFFHNKFSLLGGFGILLAIGGVILLSTNKSKESLQNKDKKNDKNDKNDKKILGLPEWLVYAGCGGILLTVKDLFAVKVMKKGLKPLDFAIQLNLLGALITLCMSNYFRIIFPTSIFFASFFKF